MHLAQSRDVKEAEEERQQVSQEERLQEHEREAAEHSDERKLVQEGMGAETQETQDEKHSGHSIRKRSADSADGTDSAVSTDNAKLVSESAEPMSFDSTVWDALKGDIPELREAQELNRKRAAIHAVNARIGAVSQAQAATRGAWRAARAAGALLPGYEIHA